MWSPLSNVVSDARRHDGVGVGGGWSGSSMTTTTTNDDLITRKYVMLKNTVHLNNNIIHLNIEQKIGWRTCLHCLPPLPIPRWPVRSAATPSQLVPKEESLGRGRIVRYPHHLSKQIMSKNAPPAPKTRDAAMAAIAMGVKGGGS